MRLRQYFTLFSLFLSTILFSQEVQNIGAHRLQLMENGNSYQKVVLNKAQALSIALDIELFESKSNIVFGYLPYWELGRGALDNIQFDLLTHVALFNFSISSSGNITAPKNWPWTDVINKAHLNGCKVIISFTNFDLSDDDNYNMFTDEMKYNKLYENIKNLVLANNIDGINIDFEGLNTSHRGSVLNSFMLKLNTYLKGELSDLEISFASPAVNWSGWDFDGLINTVDHLFIMAYDYNGSWSSNTGPISPLLNPYGGISVTRTLERDYSSLVSSHPEKLILGVPYYGKKWKTISSNSYSEVVDYVGSTFYKNDVLELESKGRQWLETEKSSWYFWQEATWMQVWTEDSLSISYKYDLALEKKLGGVGIWALNYDSDRKELWDLIRVKFHGDADLSIDESELINLEIYPNPTKGLINIKNLEQEYIIELYDSNVRLLKSTRNSIPDLYLEAPGIYYLKVKNKEDGERTFKVVKH